MMLLRQFNNRVALSSCNRLLYSTPVAFPASLPPSQGKQIREIVLKESPKRLLEIGCFIGISSHWIASALEDLGGGVLESVDTFLPKYPNRFHFSYLVDPYRHASNALKVSGLSHRINYHCSDSVGFEKELSESDVFDFIFIDGGHTFSGIARDFITYYPRLKAGGTILLHDTNPAHCAWDGPRKFIDDVLIKCSRITVEEIETKPNFGMALIRKLDDSELDIPFLKRLRVNLSVMNYKNRNIVRNTDLAQACLKRLIKPIIAHHY